MIGNLRGNNNGYISIAFARTNRMERADLYYCTANGVFTGVIGRRFISPVSKIKLKIIYKF